ncbi:MAG TPA: hypothetical protein HA322_01105, partial [Candidatus Poseidoniaceae archaeon]|nr:hypothetical protein [Candidatus Poseidoniaceae archaeon]
MQSRRSVGAVMFLVTLFILQSASQLAINGPSNVEVVDDINQIERVYFELRDDVFSEAVGTYNYNEFLEDRLIQANTIIGTFDEYGLELSRPISAEWLQPRDDLMLVLASNDVNLKDVRMEINALEGLVIREYLPPSGLVLQGTQSALNKAANLESIVAVHNVPLALILQAELQDVLLLQDSESALLGERMRIEGWFGENGPEQTVSFSDESSEVKQDIADVVDLAFDNIIQWDIGRYEGDLANADIISIAQ